MADSREQTISKTEVITPRLYQVVFLNDDYTPMDFVVAVLREIFNKSNSEAYQITMDVHKNGRGIAGIYSYDIANQKVIEVLNVAGQYHHPLKAVAEPC